MLNGALIAAGSAGHGLPLAAEAYTAESAVRESDTFTGNIAPTVARKGTNVASFGIRTKV